MQELTLSQIGWRPDCCKNMFKDAPRHLIVELLLRPGVCPGTYTGLVIRYRMLPSRVIVDPGRVDIQLQ